MQKFASLLVFLALAAFQSQATMVVSSAGKLSSNITDTDITELTIIGSMNACDFKFVADHLHRLNCIDLSFVNIEGYEAEEPVFAQQTVYQSNEIPQTAFFGKPLTSITLPSDVKIIGYAAFAGCNKLTHISFPATLDSIASYAFSATGLTSVQVPASISRMGEGVFSRCPALTSATINSKLIGKKTFFANEQLSNITIGENVTAIGESAFAGCNRISTLQWSSASQLRSIGAEAFIATQMTDADLSKFPQLTSLGAWAYAGTPISQVALPGAVEAVGEGAFYYAKKITHLVLPSKVTKVSAYLAAGTGVSNSNIWGENTHVIDDYALYNLSGITSLTIPVSVTQIGTQAMAGTTGLHEITAHPEETPTLGMHVWAGIDQQQVRLYAPSALYAEAAQWRDFDVKRKYYLGDANADELVNVTDITSIINYILSNDPTPFNFEAADCATDGRINVSDITAVIALILRGETPEVITDWEPNTTDLVSIADFSIIPGETATVDVTLSNDIAYTALQFDIQLPDGLELVSISKTDRMARHTIHSATLPDGAVRVLGYHLQNQDIDSRQGAILTLKVKANEAFPTDAAIVVNHTVLATAYSESFFAPATSARVSRTSSLTDVNESSCKVFAKGRTVVIESNAQGVAQLVNLQGRSINLAVEAGVNEYEIPEQGVYIVRMNNISHKLILK